MPSPQDLSIRQLQYLVAVAETLGFRRAAERCHVSQPTLSAQIRELEGVLGVQLFERTRRRVAVTRAGEALVPRARAVLVALDDVLDEAKRLKDPFAGTLEIGVIPTVAPYLLPDLTPALTARYPKLSVVYREEKTADIVRHLDEGKLDAGLLALEADIGDCASALVQKDLFVVALPKGHRLTKKAKVALEDLEEERVLLLDDGHCFREQALAACSRAGVQEAAFRATSLSTLAQMVSSGAGVTLLPALAVEAENRRGQLTIRPLRAPAPSRTIALVWRRRSALGASLRELAATMKGAVRRVHPS
ncbi:MAG: LysR family transcriptional regulator [Polyangiaceae bacterium]|nr:LysR family transcriptional regulator [Polyangiaceae bacterium]